MGGIPVTVLLTGASGGIGSAIARALAEEGHRLMLVGRNTGRLQQLRATLANSSRHIVITANLLDAAQRGALVSACAALPGGVDVLINGAGVSTFAELGDIGDTELGAMLHTNLLVPIALTRNLLPLLRNSKNPAVINIGSAFGHIGHPGFSVYSASKFGLHGFTEAMRRELSDSCIAVHYLAPRAVDTELNTEAVNSLNRALGNKSDPPEMVARQVLNLLGERCSARRFIGWPERIFIKLNALFPSLVDGALGKKVPLIRRYAKQNWARQNCTSGETS
ncbi:SDR family oxidoreductase [Microbulbifer rhizosphaerae]|uniref:Short-subunit dehydrogenase n=1 Tax=Microbulbifer rhizosphaerae TaxID=1562603 RepID=A0A7W4WDY6_9GAMM|nr:SDR family oxidoreductase [Microbulbifer rhizosphaerae]MBB3062454.1 short-subunit dehydrogenase [Microbulbifer rhizosphaerae]